MIMTLHHALCLQKEKTIERPTTLLGLGAASLHDESSFDCCITVCGCGDNLQDAHDLSRINNRETYTTTVDGNDTDTATGGNNKNGLWSSIRFKRLGKIEDSKMVAIQPATSNDPTRPGYLGTHAFRASKDSYNQALSFSIVTSAIGGVNTLDIECSAEEDYFILLSGFLMLCTEAHLRHDQNKKLKEQEKLERSESKLSVAWEKYQASLFPPEAKKMDPIDALFYVSSGLMLPLKFNTVMNPGEEEKKRDFDLIPPSQFLGWKSAGTQIWARLRLAGLDVKCVFSWDLRRVILKLKCPQWRLEEVAEKMHMKLKKRDGTFKRFKRSRRGTFVAAGFNGSIFRSSERQRIIDFILRSKIVDGGAELGEDTKLGRCIKSRFPLHMHERLDMLKHSWVTFWKIEQPGEIATPWSVLDVPLKVTCKRIWTSAKWTWDGLLSQPLDSIAEYYGEDVAFYFAWMSFFSRWLVLPSLLGIIVFCGQVYDRKLDHWLCIPYAVLIIMWSCVLLAFWRQKAATLAHRWGVLDHDVEETERPQFKGKYTFDPTMGEIRKLYPSWKRFLKYCVSYPIIMFFVGSVLVLMIVTSTTNEDLSTQYDNGEYLDYTPRFRESFSSPSSSSSDGNIVTNEKSNEESEGSSLSNIGDINYWIVNLIYPSIYGLITNVAAEIFEMLAVALTDFENHQTESNYWNQLIIKIFSVRFVTVFTSIFYYAFRTGIDSEMAYKLMSLAIFAFITVGDWWGKFIQICVPSWLQRFRLYRMKAAVVTLRKHIWKLRAHEVGGENGLYMMARRQHYLSQSQEQCWQEALKKNYNTFGDYTRLMIQLGFVLFFAAVFPLSPLIVLINNVFFIRLDAFKLTNTRKRPIAQKSAGLGVWEDILQVMSVAGIITNCCIVGITSSVLPRWLRAYGTVGVAIVLFFFEHIMLLFKYMLHKAIPKIPITVQREIIGILPNGTDKKGKGGPTKKKKRPKYVKEFNLHDDDQFYDGPALQPAAASEDHLLDDSKIDLFIDNDESAEHPDKMGDYDIPLSPTIRSIADDICSELSDDIENLYRGSLGPSSQSAVSSSPHTSQERQLCPPRGGAKGGIRRRSSIRNVLGPAQTAIRTSALPKSPMPRRSAVLYKKNHPLARESDPSQYGSDSEDSSSNDDVSVTRLKMKIQALKRQGKKKKAAGEELMWSRSRSYEDGSNDDDESPTSRARRRIALSSRIPFKAYPAHVIVRNNSFKYLEPEPEADGRQGMEQPRKRSSIIDPVIDFLQRGSRSHSKDSQDSKSETVYGNRKPPHFALEMPQMSGRMQQCAAISANEEYMNRVSINNVPSTKISSEESQRSKSIASTAWSFMRGMGFSNRPSQADKQPQPVQTMSMDKSNEGTASGEEREFDIAVSESEHLPTYEESQRMPLVQEQTVQSEKSVQSNGGQFVEKVISRHPQEKREHKRSAANLSAPRQATEEISPTISSIQGKGTVRSVASAINSKSPATITQQRQAEAYKTHIGRNRQAGNPLTRTPISGSKKKEPIVLSAPNSAARKAHTPEIQVRGARDNHQEVLIGKNTTFLNKNEWESIPESACFIGRLKDQSGSKRQSFAESPFMSIVNGQQVHDDIYEESPEESVATVPKSSEHGFTSPPRGNLQLHYDDDEYEPSPPDISELQYFNQYSEDYEDDTYEDSPVSNRGGRKSIMRNSRRYSMHHQENINYQQHGTPTIGAIHSDYEEDESYEDSPPSPRRRAMTNRVTDRTPQHKSSKKHHFLPGGRPEYMVR